MFFSKIFYSFSFSFLISFCSIFTFSKIYTRNDCIEFDDIKSFSCLDVTSHFMVLFISIQSKNSRNKRLTNKQYKRTNKQTNKQTTPTFHWVDLLTFNLIQLNWMMQWFNDQKHNQSTIELQIHTNFHWVSFIIFLSS